MIDAEALQYVKLNPGEEVKYGEYWAQAVGDGENVGGKEAVAFLGGAKKVSKGQLRRIWDIADHRSEGFLGRDEFYVALRLVALAQRGAELSVGGLRNFSGIQLIPDIAPIQKKEEPKQQVTTKPDVFSWTVPKEVVEKYDGLFKKLDAGNVGMIDGKQAVTFFGKSGLPRPTLKKIWDLADVTRDGMLSLDEFRNAMHMVSNILSRKLTATALPSALDPSGPNWLRTESEEGAALPDDGQPQTADNTHDPVVVQMPTTSPIVTAPPPPPQQSESISVTPPQVSQQTHDLFTPSANNQAVPIGQSTVQSDEAEKMREALLKERREIERARLEMEQIKAEMEKLRLEKESFAAAKAQEAQTAQAVQAAALVQPQSTIPSPKLATNLPYMQNQSPVLQPQRSAIPVVAPSPPVSSVASASPPLASSAMPISLGATIPPISVSKPAPQGAVRAKPISLGNDDDDIWDQPSPKASAIPGPSVETVKDNNTSGQKDSVSSDADDDFWGGLGAKPTLGPAGGQKPGEAKQEGFGGSELDDWVF